ncbi:flagellar hook-length control protein FliK [Sutcliffiella deserti]|uniref:flagellar hook-length control protein FliK n=1 Tax=Sutcliffiella deserti TaxID=2875501 RepID=UPI001CC1252F|nr:flagellar hook-length control protein FliK [Sutcliffiella deserti]
MMLIPGDIENAVQNNPLQLKNEKSQKVDLPEDGKFHQLLSTSLLALLSESLPETNKLTNHIEMETDTQIETLLEEMNEILHLELSLLNSLEGENVPEEYYALIEDLLAFTEIVNQMQQAIQNVPQQAINVQQLPEKLSHISEKVIIFIKQWAEGMEEKKELQPLKQQSDIRELMVLIAKKLEKVFPDSSNQVQRMDTSQSKVIPFSRHLNDGESINTFSMHLLQQPKQATIQLTLDTTTSQVAREQLIQKLEAILSKSHTRLVNGHQSMTIRLNPEHLGTLHIKLQDSQNGLIAKLVAHSKVSASLLEGGVASLKQNLLNANINVDKIEIVYQEQEQLSLQQGRQQEKQQSHPGANINNNHSKEEQDKSFEELLLEEIETNQSIGEGL